MHSMADGAMSLREIDRSAYLLAVRGRKIVREFCAAAQRLKKRKATWMK